MMSKERVFIVALLFVGLVSALHGQNIITFDVPNAVYTDPTGINPSGQITGDYSGADLMHHGFLRERNGAIIRFDVAGSTETFPTAIDTLGNVIGYSDGPTSQPEPLVFNTIRGFIRHPNGTIVLFDACSSARPPFLENGETFPRATNAFGEIVGQCQQTIDIDTFDYGFVRQPNGTAAPINTIAACENRVLGFTDAVAVNLSGHVTGSCSNGPGPKLGFVQNPDGAITTFNVDDVAEATSTKPTAISQSGQITGIYTDVQGTEQAFLRQRNGTISLFSVGNAVATNPQGISPAGRIAGFWVDGNNEDHGFVRKENGHSVSFDVPGATDTTPVALKNGMITGHYSTANGDVHGFFVRIEDLLEQHHHGWDMTDLDLP
ncbi:hypothetical protein H7849_17925 [Alloacidobacterium dinghuense]|uniref:Uncharacterized protein n=1 Tax=Alloacidobacterium dinghuense TaxID=2763107 RepID=A0A7G8BEK7_9BACT|nr:hypothetical protein [Alloacidobacterium dinghuense]QNI30977.1 hypothetical protein H7849_17925 [Alloacidobacterium dinghuense]